MKAIGIQIKSEETIIVVVEKDDTGFILQTSESSKFVVNDHNKPSQIKQFRDQINSLFDSINPSRIGIVARNPNGNGQRATSPISFKLEGIIQLYEKNEIEIIWPQTINKYYKTNPKDLKSNKKYQEDAFDLAYYLINQQ